jgi:NADP-dependent 3-hydroxy acid dehydrogenase YdfG
MGALQGRRVLVTGASSGIGRATAEAVVAAGGRVALLARSADALGELARSLHGGRGVAGRMPGGADPSVTMDGPALEGEPEVVGPRGGVDGPVAVVVPADVTDAVAVTEAVRKAGTALGGLDAVVNAAGVVRPGSMDTTGPDDWRVTFEVNVLGLLHVTQAALGSLRAEEAADVVNISSLSGRRRASVAMTVYSASKHAVHVISDGLREELGHEGIRVTVVSPGFVRTPIFDEVAVDDLRTRYQGALAEHGLDPAVVAAQVVHALAQPPGVDLFEIAVLSTGQ